MKHITVFLTTFLFVAISAAQTVAFVNASDETNHLNNRFLPEYMQSDGAAEAVSNLSTASTVTNVEVIVSPTTEPNCEGSVKRFTFTAHIKTDGPCTVKYKWLRSDGAIDTYAPWVLNFTSAGVQAVTSTWDLSPTNFEGWKAIEVMTPNSFISNKALFSLTCEGKTQAFNCKENPWKLTPCAQALLQSFKDLVAGTGVCYGTHFPTVRSTMPEHCFLSSTVPGVVSFASFKITPEYEPSSLGSFGVIWGSRIEDYLYYGVCPPDPNIHRAGLGDNHVYGVKLVRQSDYRAAPLPTNFLTMPIVRVADIAAIEGYYVEPNTDYMTSSDPGNYSNVFSSKGIVVKVRMRDGREELCYLLNNYDATITVTWKERNDCK